MRGDVDAASLISRRCCHIAAPRMPASAPRYIITLLISVDCQQLLMMLPLAAIIYDA